MDQKSLLQNRSKGFTLIELTVALLLISVVLGLTLPRIGNLVYSRDLKDSVRRLRALLTAAQSLSVSDRTPRRVVCDLTAGTLRIQRELREEGEDRVLVHYEDDHSVLLEAYRFPEGVKIQDVITETGDKKSEGEAYLAIGPNGIFSGNIIHLRKGEEPYTLRINPLTGRVTIEAGYIEEYKVTVAERE